MMIYCFLLPSWLSPAKRLIRNQQIEGSNPSGGLAYKKNFNLVLSNTKFLFHDGAVDSQTEEIQGVVDLSNISSGISRSDW